MFVRLASVAMRSDQFRLIRYAFAGVVVSLGYTSPLSHLLNGGA